MKEIIKLIFKNKRYRAILYLCLYFIFFGLIFIITSIPSNQTKVNEDEIVEEKIYNETIYINNEKIYVSVNNNDIKISYDNIEYKPIDNLFKYNEIIPYLKKQYILDLIKELEYESKTIYKDGKVEEKYLINSIEINIIEKEKIVESNVKINNNVYKIVY